MKPIIDLEYTQSRLGFIEKTRDDLDERIYRCVVNVGVNVDRERLWKALINSKAFYDEGYADGKRDSEPKKPFVDVGDFYKCPCCHTVVRNTYKYCHECGIELDWSDEK